MATISDEELKEYQDLKRFRIRLDITAKTDYSKCSGLSPNQIRDLLVKDVLDKLN